MLVVSIVHDTTTKPVSIQVPRESVRPSIQEWAKEDSKTYAFGKLGVWVEREWVCLEKLWTKESNWNPRSYNKIKVDGKNAGGIPQLLGLDPRTHPTYQIEQGLKYIYHRYGTPCKAWSYWKEHRWY